MRKCRLQPKPQALCRGALELHRERCPGIHGSTQAHPDGNSHHVHRPGCLLDRRSRQLGDLAEVRHHSNNLLGFVPFEAHAGYCDVVLHRQRGKGSVERVPLVTEVAVQRDAEQMVFLPSVNLVFAHRRRPRLEDPAVHLACRQRLEGGVCVDPEGALQAIRAIRVSRHDGSSSSCQGFHLPCLVQLVSTKALRGQALHSRVCRTRLVVTGPVAGGRATSGRPRREPRESGQHATCDNMQHPCAPWPR